jgi:hypothetical protein
MVEGDNCVEGENGVFEGISENSSGAILSSVASEESD